MSAKTKEETAEQPKEYPAIVKELHEIDERYSDLVKEYEKEAKSLMRKYMKLRRPIFEERMTALTDAAKAEEGASTEETGTPALKGFWLEALKRHRATDMGIFDYDEPVLQYLKDIQVDMLDDKERDGFKVTFRFSENPYIRNHKLVKEYYTSRPCMYKDDVDIDEIKATEVEWRRGKDITISKDKDSEKEEPRPSFFRNFFVPLKKGDPIPKSLDEYEYSDAEDAEDALLRIMDVDYEQATTIKQYIVPHAVRWYTGEACPSMYDDFSDGSSFLESYEDDYSADSDDDSQASQRKIEEIKDE